LSEITLDLWACFVANLVKQQVEPVILVGHSRGGIVISQASEYVPDRIAALVYLTAFLVPGGARCGRPCKRCPAILRARWTSPCLRTERARR
jgi:pimeloyl-ACP methyl ester carboxylesterase